MKIQMACSFCIGAVLSFFWPFFQQKPEPLYTPKIERRAYELVYDGQHKQALFVYQSLSPSTSSFSDIDRNQFHFLEDPILPPPLQSSKKDYFKSGFHRGHLCPAADAKFDPEAMQETFYLSNISPQSPSLNKGHWVKLEKHVRDLAAEHPLHVFTGPLYLSERRSDGKRFVQYQVIGESEVAVPTHFFKVIFNENLEFLEAFILPNRFIPNETPLEEFKAPLDQVEKYSGIVFSSS